MPIGFVVRFRFVNIFQIHFYSDFYDLLKILKYSGITHVTYLPFLVQICNLEIYFYVFGCE